MDEDQVLSSSAPDNMARANSTDGSEQSRRHGGFDGDNNHHHGHHHGHHDGGHGNGDDQSDGANGAFVAGGEHHHGHHHGDHHGDGRWQGDQQADSTLPAPVVDQGSDGVSSQQPTDDTQQVPVQPLPVPTDQPAVTVPVAGGQDGAGNSGGNDWSAVQPGGTPTSDTPSNDTPINDTPSAPTQPVYGGSVDTSGSDPNNTQPSSPVDVVGMTGAS